VRRAIREGARPFSAILVLGLIAALVGGYILSHQRLRFPWEGKPFVLKAEFSTAQAVTPGQGQTVRVSGVRIGDISKVELKEGRAIISMDVDPEFKGLVHTDATALMRPKTGLKDIFIELTPGTKGAPVAPGGFTIPIRNTLPDVNPDEILASLDADTRDYLKLLVGGAGQGLDKRGNDLQEVFRRFEPTHRDLARVTEKVAERRANLRRLIHSLNALNGELAGKGKELSQVVSASSEVFDAFASEQANVSRAVGDLPGALQETTKTLGKVQTLADVLGPAVTRLRPAVRKLDDANRAIIPLAKEATPLLTQDIRPFVRSARPLVRQLRPAATDLSKATPKLTASFTVLNHLFNLLGHNAGGKQGPGTPGRDEGYLYWIAWLQHNGASVFSSADANGSFRPITVAGTCGTLQQTANTNPALALLFAPALLDPKVCDF
jgi:phospholipid/cholesterol/gamma-HCH transport system substrate-binding protein